MDSQRQPCGQHEPSEQLADQQHQRLGSGDCERWPAGCGAQPVNSATSLGYVVAGAVVRARAARPRSAESALVGASNIYAEALRERKMSDRAVATARSRRHGRDGTVGGWQVVALCDLVPAVLLLPFAFVGLLVATLPLPWRPHRGRAERTDRPRTRHERFVRAVLDRESGRLDREEFAVTVQGLARHPAAISHMPRPQDGRP